MAEVDNSTGHYSSLIDLAAKSVEIVKRNWKMFLLVNIMAVFSTIFTILGGDKDQSMFGTNFNGMAFTRSLSDGDIVAAAGLALLIGLIFFIASIFLAAMSTSLMVRTSKGEQPDTDTLIDTAKKLWIRQLGLFIVMALIIVAGLILLIVPGIIAIIRLCMAPYIMFEKNLGIMDSIKASNQLAKQHMGLVAGALLVIILAGIAASIISAVPVIGAIAGLAISIALSMVLPLRYRELASRKPSTAH